VRDAPELKKSLGPLTLWGLGVGDVISGEYFGWNLGLPVGGGGGMLVALGLVAVMYVGIALAYSELACGGHGGGGAHAYARAAFGPRTAAFVGYAQAIEFVFAPPAIAMAIGAYVTQRYPGLDPLWPAMGAYLVFTALNAWGVQQAAVFELWVTLLAVLELLLFMGLTLPHASAEQLALGTFPNGARGVLHCLPFAIWFFLGIEGLATTAEEARDAPRDLPRAFLASLGTLLVLALGVFVGAVGVAGAHGVVFAPGSHTPSDAPLPLALAHVVPRSSVFYELLLGVGVLGLLASFHGILFAAGRATLGLGRAGLLPRALGRVHAGSGTPRLALVANMLVGLVAMLSGHTQGLISVAVLGALVTYVSSLGALVKLRPGAERPGFMAPFHPTLTLAALALCVVAAGAIALTEPRATAGFAAVLVALSALGRRP